MFQLRSRKCDWVLCVMSEDEFCISFHLLLPARGKDQILQHHQCQRTGATGRDRAPCSPVGARAAFLSCWVDWKRIFSSIPLLRPSVRCNEKDPSCLSTEQWFCYQPFWSLAPKVPDVVQLWPCSHSLTRLSCRAVCRLYWSSGCWWCLLLTSGMLWVVFIDSQRSSGVAVLLSRFAVQW